MMQRDFVARARALVGCKFRPQGRVPATGLDCVGLALEVYDMRGAFRRNYRLRGDYRREVEAALHPFFRPVPQSQRRAGDLCLWAVAADQLHLGIHAGASFIHADATLRRLVETPGVAPWRLIRTYRRRVRKPRRG